MPSLEELLGGIFGEPPKRESDPNRKADARAPRGRVQIPLPRTPEEEDDAISNVMHAVVQVVALRQGFMGGMSSAWTGSGTLVDPSGIILTNCHVANPRAMGMSSPPADRLGIAITDRSDEPPAISYFAQVVAQNPELDLAVLRIVADLKGRRVNKLNLPSVDLGDSDTLQLGDRLAIFGFPGIGGETVTFTSGNVSGFSRERGVRDNRAWIKTDATIAGGNSGGCAVNQDGKLVGVPTQAAAGAGITPVDARPVLDTNRDGRVDHRDTPMAIGGFINGLRPVNLAYPLLEKAGMRIEVERGGKVRRRDSIFPSEFRIDPQYDRRPPEKPEFSNLLFSTRITEDGRPIHPSDQLPAGVDTVYATFQHDGMAEGTPWSVVWMTDGEVIIEQKDNWDEAEEGRKAVKISNNNGVPDGEYHLVLGIGGTIALEGKMNVGNPVDTTDSEISGTVLDAHSGRPIEGAVVIALRPGATAHQFLQTQDNRYVQSNATSGRDGQFVLPEQLPKGQAYGLIVAARGYTLVAVDGALRVSPRAPEKANIGEVKLERET